MYFSYHKAVIHVGREEVYDDRRRHISAILYDSMVHKVTSDGAWGLQSTVINSLCLKLNIVKSFGNGQGIKCYSGWIPFRNSLPSNVRNGERAVSSRRNIMYFHMKCHERVDILEALR